METTSRPRVRSSIVWLCLVLAVAALLRASAFPCRYDFRDGDELGYLQGGLQLIEGLPPPLHYAPGAPEAWLGWMHAGLLSCRYMLVPTAEERAVAPQVRPFTAINHALFDLYRDMSGMRIEFIVLSMLVSLLAVAAGFRLGLRWGGVGGAILLGGLMSCVPMLIEQSASAKPYSLAWSLSMIALYFAARTDRRSRLVSAVVMGLAIASRIEMLILLPLACLLLSTSRASFAGHLRMTGRYLAIAVVTAQLAAPWLLTNLVGNLRAIVTVRFGPAVGPEINWRQMLWTVAWGQGLLVVTALVVVAGAIVLVLRRRGEPVVGRTSSASCGAGDTPSGAAGWLIIAFSCLVFVTVVQNTGHGLRHHGPAILALLVIAPLALSPLTRGWPRAVWYVVGLAIALPLCQSLRWIWAYRHSARPEDATAWIESRVPAGAVVYTSSTFHDLLPTPQSADDDWNEVTGSDAAVRKFKSGLARFGLRDTAMPRALSEQLMMAERGGPRRSYILGSRSALAGPRYLVRRFRNSAVFGLQDPVPEFARTGGVLVWRGAGPTPKLSDPFVTWTNAYGEGTYIYVSSDLRARLASSPPK